ncbi:DUF6726 family protein [Cupriavidus metallidurans]|uniref:DUF6726 family protein n=1 Tax=Cupriavidus sp. HMR-1 TaxID=1249621 RepID=UPI000A2F2994|nr:DUF6726 family protein [Cupriavidus metallidurans]HBO78724.1 hypothetical protein [Cupriavidus sp.]
MNQQHELNRREKVRCAHWIKWFALGTACVALSGCGVAAAPCRIVSAGLKAVPLVGHFAALPTDACGAVVDP